MGKFRKMKDKQLEKEGQKKDKPNKDERHFNGTVVNHTESAR